MQVRKLDAPARLTHDGVEHYFCSDQCRDQFAREHERPTS
jgi:YHS domain-containing protein